jgi:hypothetical protein
VGELSVVPDRHQQALANSDLSLVTEDLAGREAYWRCARLPSEILAASVAVIDFCLVSITAAAIFALYSNIFNMFIANLGLYVPSTLLTATLLVGDFEGLGGYQLKQLLRLDWQLTRIL